MVRHINRIISIVAKNKIPTILFFTAAFLRLYRIAPFTTFLSDQGRDAIIVKRIVTLEHLTAIGPPTSVGHIFLGPFYYYLIAPFLLISRLNPVGMAVGMALISIAGMGVCYWMVRREFGHRVATIFLVLMTFSSILIEYSRFSWNPNPLPYFAFATIYAWYISLKTHSIRWAVTAGSLLALSLQLHYLANLLALPMFLSLIVAVIYNRRILVWIKIIAATCAGVAFFSAPLILFDLKHGFINSKNFIGLFSGKEVSSGGISSGGIQQTAQAFFTPALNFHISTPAVLFFMLFIAMLGLYVLRTKSSKLIPIHATLILLYILGFSYLVSYRHPHYYMSIYLSFYLLLAYTINRIASRTIYIRFALITLMILYIGANAKNYYFFTREPNEQVRHAQRVAISLEKQIKNKPFNIATWPIDFAEDPYLYFLELKGHKPANRELSEVTEQMFVLCNTEPCSIINSPSWNINMFGPAKVAYKWKVEGIIIYKLVHER